MTVPVAPEIVRLVEEGARSVAKSGVAETSTSSEPDTPARSPSPLKAMVAVLSGASAKPVIASEESAGASTDTQPSSVTFPSASTRTAWRRQPPAPSLSASP